MPGRSQKQRRRRSQREADDVFDETTAAPGLFEWSADGDTARRTATTDLGWSGCCTTTRTWRSATTPPDLAKLFATAGLRPAATPQIHRLCLACPAVPSYDVGLLRRQALAAFPEHHHLLISMELSDHGHPSAVSNALDSWESSAATSTPPSPSAAVDLFTLSLASLEAVFSGGDAEPPAGRRREDAPAVADSAEPFFAELERCTARLTEKGGAVMEVFTAKGFLGSIQRQRLVYTLKRAVRAVKGRGCLLLSSGTSDPLLLRRPEDYANLLTLGGVSYSEGSAMMHAANATLYRSATGADPAAVVLLPPRAAPAVPSAAPRRGAVQPRAGQGVGAVVDDEEEEEEEEDDGGAAVEPCRAGFSDSDSGSGSGGAAAKRRRVAPR